MVVINMGQEREIGLLIKIPINSVQVFHVKLIPELPPSMVKNIGSLLFRHPNHFRGERNIFGFSFVCADFHDLTIGKKENVFPFFVYVQLSTPFVKLGQKFSFLIV